MLPRRSKPNLGQAEIAAYLELRRGREVHLDSIMKDLQIDPRDRGQLTAVIADLRKKRLIKPAGRRDGWYKVLLDIKPVKVAGVDATKFFDLSFPMSHRDAHSSFGFEDLFSVSEGDLVVIAGTSNVGKTALVLTLLGENITKHPCVLMGNEHTTSDGLIMPKFKRRLQNMNWASFFNGSGELTFSLLPVAEDYEDWVEAGKINIVDWISLDDKLWLVGNTLDRIKKAVGKGVAVAVLQKKQGYTYAYGQEATEHYADVYMTIDPLGNFESRLTLGKIKEPKTRTKGRMWGFEIVDNGANLTNIREITKCFQCWGKGWTKSGKCEPCLGKGYIDLITDKNAVPF